MTNYIKYPCILAAIDTVTITIIITITTNATIIKSVCIYFT